MATMISEFKLQKEEYNGITLKDIEAELYPTNIFLNEHDPASCEYCINICWASDADGERTIDRTTNPPQNPYWVTNHGLFFTQRIVCSLENQLHTIEYIKTRFRVDFIYE